MSELGVLRAAWFKTGLFYGMDHNYVKLRL